jgi:hypothetical protein
VPDRSTKEALYRFTETPEKILHHFSDGRLCSLVENIASTKYEEDGNMDAIKELWHGNIIPQEDSRTNSKEMKNMPSSSERGSLWIYREIQKDNR